VCVGGCWRVLACVSGCVDVYVCVSLYQYLISFGLLGIHKKFPDVLCKKELHSFKCAGDFAEFIERYENMLTNVIEQAAKKAGVLLFFIIQNLYLIIFNLQLIVVKRETSLGMFQLT